MIKQAYFRGLELIRKVAQQLPAAPDSDRQLTWDQLTDYEQGYLKGRLLHYPSTPHRLRGLKNLPTPPGKSRDIVDPGIWRPAVKKPFQVGPLPRWWQQQKKQEQKPNPTPVPEFKFDRNKLIQAFRKARRPKQWSREDVQF